jgi:hypothetical protein
LRCSAFFSSGLLFLLTMPLLGQAGGPTLAIDSSAGDSLPGWHLVGGSPWLYRLTLDSTSHPERHPSLLLSPGAGAFESTWAAAAQTVLAGAFRGKRVMFSGVCHFSGVIQAGLWLRADGLVAGEPGQVAFDNLKGRPLRGTGDWHEYHVVLDVPPNAEYLSFGVHLQGTGEIWLADVTLETPPPWFPPTVKTNFAFQYPTSERAQYYRLAQRAAPALIPVGGVRTERE